MTEESKKETKEILKQIPKEFHSLIHKMNATFYYQGVRDCQILVEQVTSCPPKTITEFFVIHESEIDGG